MLANWSHESLMVVWDCQPYRLELYQRPWSIIGRAYVGYRFFCDGRLIFQGEDYSPSPTQSVDGIDSVRGLLGFLSCKPGDTDPEYFKDYTPVQMEFARCHGEELSLYSYDDSESDLAERLTLDYDAAPLAVSDEDLAALVAVATETDGDDDYEEES